MKKLKKAILCSVLALSTAFSSLTFGSFAASAVATDSEIVSAESEISSVGAANYGLADNIQDGVILHCFDWKYNDIKAELPNIAEAGFTAVQTSPAQPADSSGTWYWLYQPLGFYIGTNDLGTKSDLQSLCTEAEKYGIKVVVDVVANHLTGDHSRIDNDLKSSQYWHNYGSVSNWADRYQVTHGEIGMPDLNTENSYVQNKVKNYIAELKSVGVDGIRFDAAKHIGLPSEGDNFWANITSDKSLWYYGEILGGPDDRQSGNEGLMKEYTNYISVTDSNYCKQLRDSFSSGSVPSSFGNWSAKGVSNDKLVYWGESHDTWSNNQDWGYSNGMSQNVIDRAYAVAASRNDISALYFSRPSSSYKENIKAGQKGSTHFTSSEVAEVNKFHNAMIGKEDYYLSSNGCAVITRKDGGAVIVKGSGSGNVSVTNGGGYAKPGTYVDQISGNTFTVTSSNISGTVGSSGIAVIYDAVKSPSASVTPGTKSYKTDTLTLTLNYKNATSGQYSIDGGVYKSFADGQQITIGKGLAYGTKTTVTVKASNGTETSQEETYTYTKVDPTLTQKIYFDNSSYNWSSVYAYIYNEFGSSSGGSESGGDGGESSVSPSGTVQFTDNQGWGDNIYAYFWSDSQTDIGGAWPGTKMGNPTNNGMGQNNYSVSIPDGATYVIFTNGYDQTSDIYISGFEGYYTDNSRDSSGHLNAIGWNSNKGLLYSPLIGSSSASLADEVAAWPGVKMTYDSATGYYVTEVPEGYENAYVIFTEGENATTNRYPADLEPGLPLEGVTKLFSANHSFEPYTPVKPTEPTTQPTTKPTTQPTTQPTTKPTTQPTTQPESGSISVTAKSNVFPTAKKTFDVSEKTVTVTYKLSANMSVENTQWTLTFDSSKLKYSAANNSVNGTQTITPVVGDSLVYNNTDNRLIGNFSSVNFFEFKNDESFVSVTFEIIGTGSAEIDLYVDVLSLAYKSNNKIYDESIVDKGEIQDISDIDGFENAQISTKTTFEGTVLMGDVNFDGVIDVRDVTLIQKYIVGTEDLSVLGLKAMDVNQDNRYSIADATMIQIYIISGVNGETGCCGQYR